ncbi:hypothetical protein EC968_002998 [Mortierella alpina]|nr:hypothetical protein EC968_002998 [Mortierella alpina]
MLKKSSRFLSHTIRSMTDYNCKATIQRKVAANLLKYIINTAQHLPKPSSDQCVRNLENACSHGINSVEFALAVCRTVKERNPSATISFTFNDLPDNDFDTVLALISSSAVADFNPVLHTLGKSMYTPLVEPGTLDLVYSNASLHWISHLSLLAEEGPTHPKMTNQAREDFAAEADWTVDVMELQDIEEFGASAYRAGRITLDDIAARTADMLSSIYRNTFTSTWVEHGGLSKVQAENLMKICSETLHEALKESKTLRIYHFPGTLAAGLVTSTNGDTDAEIRFCSLFAAVSHAPATRMQEKQRINSEDLLAEYEHILNVALMTITSQPHYVKARSKINIIVVRGERRFEVAQGDTSLHTKIWFLYSML